VAIAISVSNRNIKAVKAVGLSLNMNYIVSITIKKYPKAIGRFKRIIPRAFNKSVLFSEPMISFDSNIKNINELMVKAIIV